MANRGKYVSRRALRGVCRMDSMPKSQLQVREECCRAIVDYLLAASSWEIEIDSLLALCKKEYELEIGGDI
jgi:hypothetical protein